jgi:TP901 family phage tail tape measure protein
MALERIGLGAILTTNSKPMVSGVNQARDAFGRFTTGTNKVPPTLNRVAFAFMRVSTAAAAMKAKVMASMAAIGSGIMSLGMALAPFGLLLGFGIKKAADFEKQIDAVGAVSRASTEDMKALTEEAERMGIVSAFSATQAGEGMEFLARAGANTNQIIDALTGTMNAAAADGIELGQSADIVARIVKGMGMEWGEAAHIADTLALASASANTNITGLGEAYVYGVASARQLNLGLEQTTAIFGKLADAGLKGSMGGTAFMNMMKKLAKPTAKARKLLKKWDIELTHADGSLKKVSTIVQLVDKNIRKSPDVMKQAAMSAELFGQRGARAYSALAAAGKTALDELEASLNKSSAGIGAAQEMADRRLSNLPGRLTLLMSSMEGMFIQLFTPMLTGFSKGTRQITDNLNNVIFAMKRITELTNLQAMTVENLEEMEAQWGVTTVQVAMGIIDAIGVMKNAWQSFIDAIGRAREKILGDVGEGGVRAFTKIAVVVLVAAGAIAPLLLILMLVKMAIGGIISIVSGLAGLMMAAFWPVLAIGAAVVVLWGFLRKENESFGETAIRVWGELKAWMLDAWENGLKPFIDGLMSILIPGIQFLGQVWFDVITQIKETWTDFSQYFEAVTGDLSINWHTVGQVIAGVFTVLFAIIGYVVEGAIRLIKWLIFPIKEVIMFVHNLAAAFGTIIGGDIIGGIQRLAAVLIDSLLMPVRWIIKGVMEMLELFGVKMPKALDLMVNKGFSGLLGLGEEEQVEAGKGKPKIKRAKKPDYGRAADDSMLEYEYGITPANEVAGVSPEDTAAAANAAFVEKTRMMTKEKERSDAQKLQDTLEKMSNKKTSVEVNNKMCVNGDDLTVAESKHKTEVRERSGAKDKPWQRAIRHSQGYAPSGA